MSEPSPRILLLGCGYTLSRVALQFDKQDLLLVVASKESEIKLNKEFPFVERISLSNKADIEKLFSKYSGIEIIVDSVPPLHSKRSDDPVVGVKNIAESLSVLSQLKRLIYLSTTGVFGVSDGSVVDEDTTVDPKNPRSRARWDSEQIYSSLAIDTCMLRVSAIYGPGRGIGNALKAGRFKIMGEGDQWSNRIQVEDLANVIVKVIGSDSLPSTLCVSDNSPAKQAEVVDFYCSEFNLPKPDVTTLEELKSSGSFTRLSNQRVCADRMVNLFGDLKYPSYKHGSTTEFDAP